ncbi:DUF1566 domain-containing protein [bacterium]|nr:DUF1566 domain-containing protein [bacterium]
MNKLISIICFCLVCLFLSCGRPDYDDEIGDAYWEAYGKINYDDKTDTEVTDDPTTDPTDEPTDDSATEPTDDPTVGPTDSDGADPCDTNPCEAVANSTGICHALSETTYLCGCVSNYNWNSSSGRCEAEEVSSNPCDPNPCAGVANSTGGCIQKSTTDYSCECANNYDWNAGSKKCEAKIAECSPINGLMWSSKYEEKTFYDAIDYCKSVVTCGENGWRMPTIGELRTLVKNCAKTETGGSCKVTDNCVSSQCDSDNCYLPRCGSSSHSIFGDTNSLWSSSYKLEDEVATTAAVAWKINFTDASISASNTGTTYNFRCVRKAN